MFLTKKTMENTLGVAEMAITTAMNDEEVKTPLLEYNYDESRLQEGLDLHKIAKQKYQQQVKEKGEKLQARENIEKTYNEANPVYIEHITLTRMALKKRPAMKDKFSLRGSRRRDIFGWIEQAELFYKNVLEDEEALNLLSYYDLTKEKLQKGQELVLKVKTAVQTQQKEKSESQDATEKRDQAFNALSDWISDFFQVCKFALNTKPQVLERLGILALSEGYKRRRGITPEEEIVEG